MTAGGMARPTVIATISRANATLATFPGVMTQAITGLLLLLACLPRHQTKQ
jgi:hypothetical protein